VEWVAGKYFAKHKSVVSSPHHVIVYTREDFPKRVREITGGRGVPVVYDSVGRSTFAGSLNYLTSIIARRLRRARWGVQARALVNRAFMAKHRLTTPSQSLPSAGRYDSRP
jgi:hypothetical protein